MIDAITYRQAVHARACRESLGAMGDHLGGWEEYGRDTPVPLTQVLDVLGLDDTFWALEALGEDTLLRLIASDFAAHTHKYFHAAYPGDSRPADAIRVARRYATGDATTEDLAAAWDAAGDAAWAVRDARAAAWDAAGDAEEQWQVGHTCAVLTGETCAGETPITMGKEEPA